MCRIGASSRIRPPRIAAGRVAGQAGPGPAASGPGQGEKGIRLERRGRARARARSAAALALAAGLIGCAATARLRLPETPPPVQNHPRMALLPLENLSGEANAGEVFSRILFTEMVRTGCCDLVEPGEVEAVLDSLQLRSTGTVSHAHLGHLGERLGVAYVMTGSVIESGSAQTPEGQVPAVGVTIKMLDAASGRVAWAGSGFFHGDDRELLFGWGRERNAERLTASLVSELLDGFRKVARHSHGRASGGSP